MALQTATNNERQRLKEGRQALLIARSLRLLRHVKVMLTSYEQVAGQSRAFDSDMRMVRVFADDMERSAQEEGIKS